MISVNLVNLLTVTGLVAMMLEMGFRVRIEEVTASIRDRRLAAAGIATNFVLVPAVTIVLLYLFKSELLVSIGFLILAVCPGAPMGPPFTAVAKGDVPYATGQMVILAGLSAVLSPALLSLLLRPLLPTSELQIDYSAIVRTLFLSQILPLGVGLCLHQWAPKLTKRFARPVGLLANLLLLSVITIILVHEFKSLETIRLRGWFGMALLLSASLIIGWCCGGPDRARRKALAVTTCVRNAAVALVIVTSNFADTPAVTAVVAYALVSIFATLGCAVLFAGLPDKSHRGDREPQNDAELSVVE